MVRHASAGRDRNAVGANSPWQQRLVWRAQARMGPNVLANGQSKSGYQLFVKGERLDTVESLMQRPLRFPGFSGFSLASVRSEVLKQNLIAELKLPSHVVFAPSN